MRKIVSIIIFVAYGFLSIFGLVSFHHTHDHMGLMAPDCPETVCISAFGDVVSWKNISSNVILEFGMFMFLFAVLAFFYSGIANVGIRKPLFYFYKKYALPDNPYQHLFSRGILNSKVF